MRDRDTMAPTDAKFKTGNICRIYIKDFLTFDEVEVRPKPKLNFIYGPNGCGKSSILCAICICLGGQPVVTGRGREIFNFVKRGKEEAVLEVEIHVDGEVNVVVRRSINITKRSTSWWLQGKESTAAKVLKRTESLNIQVDNLCQFLPQDRVVEFAKLDHAHLLLATEKAVGDPSLHQQHQVLCEGGQLLQTHHQHQKDLRARLAEAERRNARLKKMVDNVKVKEKLEEEIKLLHSQHAWYLYDHKRKVHMQEKETLKLKDRQLKDLQRTINPVTAEIAEKKNFLHRLKKTMKEKVEFLRKSQTAVTRSQQEYERNAEEMRERMRQYEMRQAEEQQQRGEVLDYKRQLDVLVGQLQNLPMLNEEETCVRLRELTQNIHRSSQAIVDIQGSVATMCAQRDSKVHMVKTYMKELKLKEDVRYQRLSLLQQKSPDAYKAVQWLENNRDKFDGPVHLPIFTLLDISSPEYSRYVENRVMMRDLIAFVCECKDDVNVMKDAMDREKLRVNIVYSSPDKLSHFKPAHPIEELSKFGFNTYMREVISAPEAVLSFLCQNYNIHSVPIAKEISPYYNTVPPSITVFYMGNSRYSSTRSRYDGVVSMSIYPLRQVQLLSIALDKERISHLKKTITQLKAEIEEEEESIKGLKGEEEEVAKRLEEWRNEKRALTSRKEERHMLAQRIKQKETQIERHERDAINLQEEKRKMEAAFVNCLRYQVECTLPLEVSLANTVRGMCEGMRAEGKAQVLVKELQGLELAAQEQRMRLEELEAEKEALKEAVEKLKAEGTTALKKLLDLLKLKSVDDITPEIRALFQNSSLEETEKMLSEKDAHLACIVTASKNELREYRQREEEVAHLHKKLEEADWKYNNHEATMKEVQERWLPRINNLVLSISRQFSKFMARLGCSGEVLLKAAGENFTHYGMAILVKFREQQRLQELTPYQQSGGERAVATALYLLALQSLTAAPFRCVDEINQGMDPVNEREFLKMLMETEEMDNSSQYFFVTPKLQQNLEYRPEANVLVILSSQTNLPHRKHTVRRAIKRKAEVKARGRK